MPRKASSKNREWERERRERLNNCFKSLESLLPNHNPTVSLSKVDIVTKAAEYIRDLQKKNANLLEGNTDKECLEQVTLLERRVKELVDYSQLLASLLKAAGITVPPGPGPDLEVLLKRPLKWSGKLSLDQTLQQLAEARQKKFANNVAKKKKNNSRTSGQKTKENIIKVEPIQQPPSNTGGNVVRSDVVQATTKNRIKSSVKIKKKLMKVPNTVVTVSAPVAHSVIAPSNSSTVGPGTLIFTNGTVMPVLPTRVVPLPLLVSRTAKLPIAALTRPVAAHKTRGNHPTVSRPACTNKDVPGTKSKSNSTNRSGTGKTTRDMSRNHKPKKNVHLVQKPTTAGKAAIGPAKSLSTEKNGLGIIVHDSKFTLSGTHEQATAQENNGIAPAVEAEVNITVPGKEKNESEVVKNDMFDKVCTNQITATECDQSEEIINYDKSQQACQKTPEDEHKNKSAGDNMQETTDVFAKMHQEKSPRSSDKGNLNENCRGTNVNDSHHKYTENIIPASEINARNRPFEMQIDNGHCDRDMTVSSHSSVDVCAGASYEHSTTASGDMANSVDCESVNSTDKPIPLNENKIVGETSEITPNNTTCGNKRKRNDDGDCDDHDDVPESYRPTKKKGREENRKTEVNLFISLSHQEPTSKQSHSTSDSVIKTNTKSTVVSTLPSHVNYSVDSLCKTKQLLKTSVINAASEGTRNTEPSSSATSSNSVEEQNASVHEELLDVMNHITSAAKSSIDNDNFNNVLCSSLLQEKYSEKCNFVQNTWLDQSVRQIFNEPDGSREIQDTGEHSNSQGTRSVNESSINEKSDFTLLNNTYPTSQDEQKVDNIGKETNDCSKLTAYESKAQGAPKGGGLYTNTEAAPENETNAADQNNCESDRKARSDYQNMSQEKGFPDSVSGTDLSCFSGITSKTGLNDGVPQNLAAIADSDKSPTYSVVKTNGGQDSTMTPGNCHSKTSSSAEKVVSMSGELPKESSDSANNSTSSNSFSDAANLFVSQFNSEGTLAKEQTLASRKMAVSYSSPAKFPPVSSDVNTTTRTSPAAMENIDSSKSSGSPVLAGTALYKQFKDICTVVSSVTDCVSASSESVSVTGHNSSKPVEQSLPYNIQQVSETNSSVCAVSSENSVGDTNYNSHSDFKTVMGASKCQNVELKLTKSTNLKQAMNETSHSQQYTVSNKMMPVLTHDMEQKLEKTIDMCADTGSEELVSEQQTKGNQEQREAEKSENAGDVRATRSQGNEKENDGVLETAKGDCHNFFGNCHCSGPEFAGDLFASLNVPAGHCSESVSPTAQFLLSFPLVSGGSRAVDNVPDDTSVGQGAPSLLQIGVSEQSRSVGTQVCSSDTNSGTGSKIPANSEGSMSTNNNNNNNNSNNGGGSSSNNNNSSSNNNNNNNFMASASSSYSKISGSLPSIGNDQHNLPLFKTPTNNRFSFTYESCGPVNKRSVETSPIKISYGTCDSFHTNFTLPEPCLSSLPFDKTFDHNKSFQYTNLSKHPITGRETCHLPVSIPSGLCSSQQSNNVTTNFMQSDTLGSGIHKVNSGGTDLFKTPLPALSVQSISQNLQSSSTVCQVPVTTSTGRFNSNNQSATSMQNLSVNSFSCTDFTTMPVPQISSFGEEVKSTTVSSFSMANSSSNFGILSWSTIPPVAAVSNISHSENFTTLRNSSDGFLPNISPPTTKIGIDSSSVKNCVRSSSVCKPGQQQLKDCASEVPRHAQGIGPSYSFPITNETGQESSRGTINSLIQSSVQNNTLQQSSYKISLPNSQTGLGSDISKGEYGNYRSAVSVASESYKKFPLPQSDAYKLMTSHAEAVPRSSESQSYKQTMSPVPQNSYSVASSSVCGETFSRTQSLHDKFKPQSSSQFDLYNSAPGIIRSDAYRTSQESHPADVPPLDQCGHFKPDFHANQKEQFKQNAGPEKPSNSKHLITSDGINNYNTNTASSFKQDSYRFLAVSSHCEQASKPGPACTSLDNYKSAVRSNKLENYRKVPHSYQPELYKRGLTSVACETHKSTQSSAQYNSCKPASSLPGEVSHLTNSHSRPPVNWMTTPDTRCNTQQIPSIFFPPATSSQMHSQNSTPLPSSALFSSQCGHMNGQTATATTLFTSVPSQTSQSVILPSVTSSLFPPVTCNHREAANSTHSLFPPASSAIYNTNGNSTTSNIFTSASSHTSSFPQVQSSLFPSTIVTTNSQSSLLFQNTTSNLLGQDNVSIPPMLLTSAASHVGQSGSSLMPLLPSVAARVSNQSSANMSSITTMSLTNQHSADRPLASIPAALLPTSSDPCAKSLSLQPPLSSTIKPVSGATNLGTLPPNTASHLFSRDGGNNFCSGSIFQSFPSSGPNVHESSPSVLLMSGSNVMGDAASSSLLCPSHVTAASSDFSSGSAPFFSSSLIPPASSVASISGQNNSCLPSSVPSTLLSTHTSSGNRQRDLNLFPGPPLPAAQHSYCRPSGPSFTGLPESGGAGSSAAAPPRPCFLSVSQLVDGNGSGKNGATRNSRRRSRRPPPPWMSGPSAPGNVYQNVPPSQQSLTQPASNKTVQQLCGRQPRPRVIPSSSSELVDLGGLLGSPLLAEDQPSTSQRPSSPPTSVNSLTNFNLSTIFPEIDKQQQQQSATGYPKSTTMMSDAQQREFPHPPSTFGNVLMSPAQICRMQWP